MNRYLAPWALLPDGWRAQVRLDVAADGTLAAVEADSPPGGAALLHGAVLPGMPNAHSHAFQRAFAGEAESQGDDFWAWRAALYQTANRLDLRELEAVTTAAYRAMLAAGYTSVAEFHYVHRDRDGRPFDDPLATWHAVVRAAQTSGIGLTLLPALYRFSDAGGIAPLAEQRRFVMPVEEFIAAWRAAHARFAGLPNLRLGVAFHSLRAVLPADVSAVLEAVRALDPDAPVHAHAAEQPAEVEACLRAYGKTPVALLDALEPLDERWTLVHATHASEDELARIRHGGASVTLAPTTEANLGDGLPDFARLEPTRIAIGSDSNVSIDVAEELRWLEYGRRLRSGRRHRLGKADAGRPASGDAVAPSLGDALYANAARAGARALARNCGALEAGRSADFILLEPAALLNAHGRPSLDRGIFRSGAWRLRATYVAGRKV